MIMKKELRLLEVESSTREQEDLKLQELHEQVMSEEAHRFYILGQIKAHLDMINEDVHGILHTVSGLRESLKSLHDSNDEDLN